MNPSIHKSSALAQHPDPLTHPTPMLDFEHPDIQRLVRERQWAALPEHERIGRIYDFVRNEMAFGYNKDNTLSASQVLADGLGQCNTKGTLLMALLRATGVACRFHGFTIDKALQKGAITGIAYRLAPKEIIRWNGRVPTPTSRKKAFARTWAFMPTRTASTRNMAAT